MKSIALALLPALAIASGPISIYVTGNNNTANETRKYLIKKQKHGCIAVVQRRADAQAVLEIAEASGYQRPGMFGDPQASGQLLDARTGDMLWSAGSKSGLLGLKLELAICNKSNQPTLQLAASVSPEEPPSLAGSAPTAPAAPQETPTSSFLNLSSTPGGADIEINKKFVGQTPSKIEVKAGIAVIAITKSGFKPWTRTLDMGSGSSVSLQADLEQETPNVIVVRPSK